jgi:hypothetical protein
MTTRSVLGMALVAAVLVAACGDDDSPSSPTTLANTASGPTSGGCTRPAAPSGLRVTAKERTTVELTWDAVPGAVTYTLLVGSVPGGTNVLNQNTVNTSLRFTARDGKNYARVQVESSPCGSGSTSPSIEFSIP